MSDVDRQRCSECGQEKPAPPKEYWTPKVGDLVWTNYPDGDCQGKVVGFMADGSRQGQPIIEAQEDRAMPGLFGRSVKKGDQHLCHPMFLLPFPYGGPEWKKARAEGRVG